MRTGYGLKLVYDDWFDSPHRDKAIHFPGGRFELVASIAVGDRALIYVTGTRLIVGAIEMVGTWREGEWMKEAQSTEFPVVVPIRLLADVPRKRGITLAEAGIRFFPHQGSTWHDISRTQFEQGLETLLARQAAVRKSA